MAHWAPIELDSASILFADDDLVAVDKASGVLCDATRDPDRDHLGIALKRWANTDENFHPAHRLDLGTSGVVVFARNQAAATAFMNQFQERTVTKRYHAIVHQPDERWTAGTTFERRSYLRHRKGVSEEVRSGGKPSATQFETVDTDGGLALVEAVPSTGRTHQLRVHLAALGAPIVGDDRYGRSEATRLWLHAHTLRLSHPVTEEPLVLRSRVQLALDAGAPTEQPSDDE